MGLAASQARFLGLTARKSNTEYQVQQINQQRVALSNEVMGLYQEYNDLEVPLPPAVKNYMKTTYTLDSSAENYTVDSYNKILAGENEGYYDVVLSWQEEIPTIYNYTPTTNISATEKTEATNGKYSYINFTIGANTYIYDESDADKSTVTKIDKDYDKYPGLTDIQKDYPSDTVFYAFTRNNVTYYTPESDVAAAMENKGESSIYSDPYTFYYQGTQTKTNSTTALAALTEEKNGRLSAIQIIECDDVPTIEGSTYSIATTQVEDSFAYDEATNEYEYQKMLYEREVERINQKTERLQEEDRALELQINQLDTEQNALKTEMESVQKVIEDTMEKVFKTFSG